MEIKILFEDENILVVDKPFGVIVNKADTVKEETLQDWVNEKLNFKAKRLSENLKGKYFVDGYDKYIEFINRGGIVHRLDKETSGIIIIAKNVESFINLQRQFKEKSVKKTYTTLVHGKILNWDGEISAKIGRLPWNRMRFGVLQEGRESISLYKVLGYKVLKNNRNSEILTLVEVYPQTGRTHQIRVHFQYIKHPVFGDELYAGRKTARQDRKFLSRHFLHASKISFINPKTRKLMEIRSPLPNELYKFINSLDNYENKN